MAFSRNFKFSMSHIVDSFGSAQVSISWQISGILDKQFTIFIEFSVGNNTLATSAFIDRQQYISWIQKTLCWPTLHVCSWQMTRLYLQIWAQHKFSKTRFPNQCELTTQTDKKTRQNEKSYNIYNYKSKCN